MSRRDVFDAVVIGAGVVGTAAALGLARDGLHVALVEASEPPRWRVDEPDLRVYAFAPDNAAQLDALGVWREVQVGRVQPYRSMRVWDAAGGAELAFHADAFGRRELGWIVEHSLLVDRLWQAVATEGIDRYCPDRVVGFSQDEQAASIELESGLRLRARLVVAADGAASPMRTLAGIAAPPHAYGQSGLVAYVETEQPHEATCWQRFLPGGPVAVLPFVDPPGAVRKGHRSSIVWTLPDGESARLLEAGDAEFLGAFEQALGGRLGRAVTVSRRASFPLARQLAERPVAGRLVLVGDAAHVVHPLAGQGVNLGLRDVGRLRAALAGGQVREPASLEARLSRWGRECRSENALAAYSFDGLNRLFSNDALVPTLLRGPLLGIAGRLPMLSHALWRHAAGL
ncbi:FAD-dependent oxidoreductase [Lysobacter korlensis]|uniref:FAD-dependent oxidoreductase n=1 Tax=Lysobacter korlensis TaxID=553636 RepID=A0ABV6RMJ3_9GAMM